MNRKALRAWAGRDGSGWGSASTGSWPSPPRTNLGHVFGLPERLHGAHHSCEVLTERAESEVESTQTIVLIDFTCHGHLYRVDLAEIVSRFVIMIHYL